MNAFIDLFVLAAIGAVFVIMWFPVLHFVTPGSGQFEYRRASVYAHGEVLIGPLEARGSLVFGIGEFAGGEPFIRLLLIRRGVILKKQTTTEHLNIGPS